MIFGSQSAKTKLPENLTIIVSSIKVYSPAKQKEIVWYHTIHQQKEIRVRDLYRLRRYFAIGNFWPTPRSVWIYWSLVSHQIKYQVSHFQVIPWNCFDFTNFVNKKKLKWTSNSEYIFGFIQGFHRSSRDFLLNF